MTKMKAEAEPQTETILKNGKSIQGAQLWNGDLSE